MIAVTGAAGKTGRAVIRALVARGLAVRALVHRAAQAEAIRALGAREVVVGDMRDPAVVGDAAAGARTIYHICPNVHPEEVRIGQVAIDAARDAGVGRIVYHSVLHPQVEAMPHHWHKMRVEEHLFASGLPYTILQPAAYMQNVLAHWDMIVGEGVYVVPYRAGTRLGMVDLEDVAAAAAIVVAGSDHTGAVYELAGPEVLTQQDVAAILGRQLGREVLARMVPLDEWEAGARAAGLGDYAVETLRAMFVYYDQHGFWGNSNVLGWLLGRRPVGFGSFVARTARQARNR